MGESRLQTEEEEHLCQCQRNHRRINALTANGEIADHKAECCGSQHAKQNANFRRHPPNLDGMGRHIGRTAKEGCMAKGQNAGIAEQQVEGGGKQRKAQHLHQEDRVDHEGRCD
ncbi:hypothetical protein D9M72_606820 [compost metagenome]